MDFGIAKFRIAKFSHCEFDIAKFSHCEIGIGIAKSILALRNFALRNFRIAKLELALRNSHCEFGIANLAMGLRNAQWPAATVPLLLHPAASHPVFNCISFPPLFL